MDILFLAHRVPFPPDRGDKIRAYNILRHLSARANVHLVAFADDPRDLDTPDLCAGQHIVPRTKSKPRAAIEALATGRSVSVAAFADRALRAAVDHVLASRPIDAIYVYSSAMAQYVPADTPARMVMDFCDVDSVKFGEYARGAGPAQRWLFAREERLLGDFDRAVAARADASLFVSDAEAALFRAIGGTGDIRVVENGIDTVRFDPAAPFAAVDAGDPLIVFTGQMDYAPNVAAVRWFASEVLPDIPDATFAIVGRAPTSEVQALAGDRVIVTGEVDDVRGWLAAAAVAVAPLRIARGIQNKVLEAMAMARPVVVSEAAAEGIDHEGTLRTAGDAADFVREISALIADRAGGDALGQAARRQVQMRYGWDARLAGLDAVLGISGPLGAGGAEASWGADPMRGEEGQPFDTLSANGAGAGASGRAAPSVRPEPVEGRSFDTGARTLPDEERCFDTLSTNGAGAGASGRAAPSVRPEPVEGPFSDTHALSSRFERRDRDSLGETVEGAVRTRQGGAA